MLCCISTNFTNTIHEKKHFGDLWPIRKLPNLRCEKLNICVLIQLTLCKPVFLFKNDKKYRTGHVEIFMIRFSKLASLSQTSNSGGDFMQAQTFY